MLHDIFNLYRNGEIIPYIILAILCVGYVIIFEKFIIMQVVYKINFEKYNAQIKKMLLANDMERARNLSRATSHTGIPMLAIKAIDAYENDPMRVKSTVMEEGLRFFPRVRRRLTQLPNFAAGCVVLGALAAVQGIWKSFQMVEGLDMGLKSFVFSKGLTFALLPLGISLIAALLLMFPFGILDAIASRLESEMEQSLCVLLNVLAPDPSFFSHAASGHGKSFAKESQVKPEEQPVSAVPPAATEPIISASPQAQASSSQPTAKASNDASSMQTMPDEEEII